MSEILDLKNNVVAMSSKLNGIVDMCTKSFAVTDKMNEILNLVHRLGFITQDNSQNIFNVILPDLVKRVSQLENKDELGKGGHVDFVVGKGKNKRKIHMFIRENGVTLYSDKQHISVDL